MKFVFEREEFIGINNVMLNICYHTVRQLPEPLAKGIIEGMVEMQKMSWEDICKSMKDGIRSNCTGIQMEWDDDTITLKFKPQMLIEFYQILPADRVGMMLGMIINMVTTITSFGKEWSEGYEAWCLKWGLEPNKPIIKNLH